MFVESFVFFFFLFDETLTSKDIIQGHVRCPTNQ